MHLGLIAITDSYLIVGAEGMAERLLPSLRLAEGRTVSREALRYHWSVFFVPAEGTDFSNEDGLDDE